MLLTLIFICFILYHISMKPSKASVCQVIKRIKAQWQKVFFLTHSRIEPKKHTQKNVAMLLQHSIQYIQKKYIKETTDIEGCTGCSTDINPTHPPQKNTHTHTIYANIISNTTNTINATALYCIVLHQKITITITITLTLMSNLFCTLSVQKLVSLCIYDYFIV